MIDGRLGQAHADLLECVMFFCEKSKIKEGRLWIVIDPHKIRRGMGNGRSKYSASSINNFELDLLRVVISIETPKHKISGHIVDKIVESEVCRNDRRAWADDEKRALQRWIFSEEWTALVQSDIPRYYDPRPLCRIEYGSVAAIARHVLTHNYKNQPNGGWKLAGLLKAAGVNRRADKVRHELMCSSDLLKELGIRLDDDRIFLSAQAPSVSAQAPFP